MTTEKRAAKAAKKHRSYGRQADGKTIKSLSLDRQLVETAEARAKALGISFSQLINELLAAQSPTPPPKSSNKKEGKGK